MGRDSSIGRSGLGHGCSLGLGWEMSFGLDRLNDLSGGRIDRWNWLPGQRSRDIGRLDSDGSLDPGGESSRLSLGSRGELEIRGAFQSGFIIYRWLRAFHWALPRTILNRDFGLELRAFPGTCFKTGLGHRPFPGSHCGALSWLGHKRSDGVVCTKESTASREEM